MKNINDLISRALEIMNERGKERNTPSRVGSLFRDIINWIDTQLQGVINEVNALNSELKQWVNSQIKSLSDKIDSLEKNKKGVFENEGRLKKAYPEPAEEGFEAYVLETGTIWLVNNGYWYDSGNPIPEDLIELADYATLIDVSQMTSEDVYQEKVLLDNFNTQDGVYYVNFNGKVIEQTGGAGYRKAHVLDVKAGDIIFVRTLINGGSGNPYLIADFNNNTTYIEPTSDTIEPYWVNILQDGKLYVNSYTALQEEKDKILVAKYSTYHIAALKQVLLNESSYIESNFLLTKDSTDYNLYTDMILYPGDILQIRVPSNFVGNVNIRGEKHIYDTTGVTLLPNTDIKESDIEHVYTVEVKTLITRLKLSKAYQSSPTQEYTLTFEKVNINKVYKSKTDFLKFDNIITAYNQKLIYNSINEKADNTAEIASIMNDLREVYVSNFSSQESMMADWEGKSYVDQSRFPNTQSRPFENAVIEDGVLKLKNKMIDPNNLIFTAAHVQLKEDILQGNFSKGCIEATYKISQAAGVNNSFWANADVLKEDGDAYYEEKFPDEEKPSSYFYELDTNEGKYSNLVSTNIHLWGDGKSKQSSRTHYQVSGTEFPESIVYLKLDKTIRTKRLRIKLGASNRIHIPLFLTFKEFPQDDMNILNQTVANQMFEKSQQSMEGVIVEADDYLEGYPASNILNSNIATEGHYVTSDNSANEEAGIIITFPHEVDINYLVFSIGYYWGERIYQDCAIRIHREYNGNWIKIYDNNKAKRDLKGFIKYSTVWDENYIYFLIDGKMIRKEKNWFVNQTPALKLSTMIADFAGEITREIDNTEMTVKGVKVYAL